MTTESIVAAALAKSPCVLFLGQHYLGEDPSTSPLFAAFAALHSASSPYRWWLESQEPSEIRATQFRAAESTVQVPDNLSLLLKLDWKCVYTSSIDSTTRRQLEIPQRRLVSQITSAGFDRLDRSVLTLVRLFGTVERPVIEELPPLDLTTLRRRRTDAASLLARLPEIITATGSLFIEGWNPLPNGDWLRPRDLDKSLVSFLPSQVLIFGLSPDEIRHLEKEEDFGQLIQQGTVLTFTERLADVFSALVLSGKISSETMPEDTHARIAYKVLRRRPDPELAAIAKDEDLATIEIEPLEWRKLTQAMTILRDLDVTEPLPDSKDSQYHEFRTFLSNGFPSPPWRWLQHLAFRRDILTPLQDTVTRLCALDTPQDHVVVVHGPSGSGKTILLQLLAIHLRRSGLPVLYVGGGPLFSDYGGLIDEFCQLVEATSAAPAVLVYDALERDDTYIGLARSLAGRGRKCLVVGSSFSWQAGSSTTRRVASTSRPRVHPIPLPARMEDSEKDKLLAHLRQFIPDAGYDLAFLIALPQMTDSYFFAVLYRLLPAARRRIAQGLIAEIKAASERIQDEIEGVSDQQYSGMTLMETQLRKALKGQEELLLGRLTAKDAAGNEYEFKHATLLINAVMLASMVGQSVPVSMALRLIRNDFRAYALSVPEDIIVEHQVSGGSMTLSARHQLEADIWIRDRLPREGDKVELLRRLVLQIRDAEVDSDESPELDFVVKVLQSFGPQGRQERFRLRYSYDQIAGIVEELRTRYRHVHPRLLLVASNAIREWVLVLQTHADAPIQLNAVRDRLQTAEDALAEAIEVVSASAERPLRGAPRRLLATLETEQACILGVQIGSVRRIVEENTRLVTAWQTQLDSYFKLARSAWLRGLGYAEDNFQAVDTACWVSDERFQAGFSDASAKIELLADWNEAIERYHDVDLPPSQTEKRDRREAEFDRALGDRQHFDHVIQRLARRNPTAAFALESRFIAKDGGPTAAREYLENNCGPDLLTSRLLIVLYFRLWWQSETGFDTFFPEKRLTLKFDRSKWTRLRELCEARLRCEGEQDNGTALFLLGCSLLHLNMTTQAMHLFERLDSLDMGGFRRARVLLLLSDYEGRSRQLTAEYRGRRRGSYSLAWCDDLGINIPFNPAEHHLMELHEGRIIGPFCVALNYRGAYALPLYRVQHLG